MIVRGALLIRHGTALPARLKIERDSSSAGWASLEGNPDRHQVEKMLATAGWTLFYQAGQIRRRGFGFHRAAMIKAALKHVLADANFLKSNSLEIDEVASGSFLGVPYISVSAHAGQIQAGTSPWLQNVGVRQEGKNVTAARNPATLAMATGVR